MKCKHCGNKYLEHGKECRCRKEFRAMCLTLKPEWWEKKGVMDRAFYAQDSTLSFVVPPTDTEQYEAYMRGWNLINRTHQNEALEEFLADEMFTIE